MSSQDVVNTVRERLQSHVTKLSSICEEVSVIILTRTTACLALDLKLLSKLASMYYNLS